VPRGAVVSLSVGILLLAGCGGSHHASTQGAGTSSVTVSDNLGPQTGPNPVTALQAVIAQYQRKGVAVEAHGCHPSHGALLWECEVKTAGCNATVGVAFDGPHDTTGEVEDSTAFCAEGSTTAQKKGCGSFVVPRGPYRVTVTGRGLHCGVATKMIHQFWFGKARRRGSDGDASSWYVLRQFPGWRCFQAAGSGTCQAPHGLDHLAATYTVVNIGHP
jgi:hypothetical protein